MGQRQEEIMERMKGAVARNPFAGYIGMELLEAGEGYARGRIPFCAQHRNIYGGMHGGCAYTLADTLAGVAAASFGGSVTTLQASVNYMEPVADTAYLYATATVQRHGAKITVVHAELTDDNGRLFIDGSFTFYTLDMRVE